MTKSIKVLPEKRGRGRPATGKDPLLTTRAPAAVIAQIDVWASRNGVSKSEAVRRLVEIGLSAPTPAKKSSASQRKRAAELAEKKIDKLIGDAPDAAVRKRRLVEGPSVVQSERRDRAKK